MAIPSPAQPDPAVAAPPALSVDGLTLRAGKRTIFADLSFAVPAGSLGVLAGPSGTGKTALALALAGRLKATSGRAVVLGENLPRRSGSVRRRTGFTGNSTVVPLDETLTIKHHVAEAVRLASPWWEISPSAARVDSAIAAANDLITALEDAFGPDGPAVPLAQARLRRSELMRDASPMARFALGLVLALLPDPDLLVVDDLDQLRTADERRAAWAALLTLGRLQGDGEGNPLTVVATCHDWRELDELLDPDHRLGNLPLRPVNVHALDAAAATDSPAADSPAPAEPAPADPTTPELLPAPEIR